MASRIMTDAEMKFIMHAVGGDPLIASYIDNQANAGYDMRQTMAQLPVCPACQRAALHHQQGVICPTCGYKGATTKLTMRDHIHGRMYR